MKSSRALTRDQNAARRFKEKRQPKIENRKSDGPVSTAIRAARLDDDLIEMVHAVFGQTGNAAFMDFDGSSFATAAGT